MAITSATANAAHFSDSLIICLSVPCLRDA
jgi:hypothetical protein